ncbi:hypothetical protein BY996DRAFT_3011039 [Phakopsora pachyrhizi]|nr:hypothetical protein BY996DRAFT_3011039 [Phakopsora pachyrhizi]
MQTKFKVYQPVIRGVELQTCHFCDRESVDSRRFYRSVFSLCYVNIFYLQVLGYIKSKSFVPPLDSFLLLGEFLFCVFYDFTFIN